MGMKFVHAVATMPKKKRDEFMTDMVFIAAKKASVSVLSENYIKNPSGQTLVLGRVYIKTGTNPDMGFFHAII